MHDGAKQLRGVHPAIDRLMAHPHVRIGWEIELQAPFDRLSRPMRLKTLHHILAQRQIGTPTMMAGPLSSLLCTLLRAHSPVHRDG
jgi:hypothetical protein